MAVNVGSGARPARSDTASWKDAGDEAGIRADTASWKDAGDEVRIRVVLADGDPLARRWLRDSIQATSGIVVVADAADGIEAVELAVYYRPDVLLCERRLRRIDGLEAMRRVHERAPEVHVVFLSTDADVTDQVEAANAGASGALSKATPIDGIVRALHGIVRGEAAVPREAYAELVERLRGVPEAGTGLRPVHSTLTPREWEVLDALCAGMSMSAISTQLGIAPATVRSHVKRVTAKLDVHGREEAVTVARERFQLQGSVI
ncbi:MAG: response regulator transcription factor [Solirubrobacteraceae bacterium]